MIPVLPRASTELAFLEYWRDTLLDPRDPQNGRWLELELGQIERGRRTAGQLAELSPLRGARVLDLGCQTGALAVALCEKGARVTGVDIDAALVRGAEIRARCHGVCAEFRVARAEALPFEDESFDLVTFIDVIEHVENASRALAEIARVLRPGGQVYIQGPNRFSPRWFFSDPHYRMFGISVLPPSLGRFYVTRVRGRPRYDVGVFPVGSRVMRDLGALGLKVTRFPLDSRYGLLGRARSALELRFASMFTLVARK